LHVGCGNHLADSDVGARDQDVGRVELGYRLWRWRGIGFFLPAGQQSGEATCANGNGKHDNTRGFHTLTFQLTLWTPTSNRCCGRNPRPEGDFTT